nr:hypothetical protein CFP56_20980 [Quercus suber]
MWAKYGVRRVCADMLGFRMRTWQARPFHPAKNSSPRATSQHSKTSSWDARYLANPSITIVTVVAGLATLACLQKQGGIFRSTHAESQSSENVDVSCGGTMSPSIELLENVRVHDEFEKHMKSAQTYVEAALWEYASKMLDEAERLAPQLDSKDVYLQRIYTERGGIERRLGDYEASIRSLEKALELNPRDSLRRATIIGELGIVYLHLNRFKEAAAKFNEQYKLCIKGAGIVHDSLTVDDAADALTTFSPAAAGDLIVSTPIWEAYGQACRAIGNLGLAEYHIAVEGRGGTSAPYVKDQDLLDNAIKHLHIRIRMAQNLRELRFDPEFYLISRAKTWQSIGWDRLTLCFVANGDSKRAVECGRQSQELTQGLRSKDPTVRALSRFYYGYALYHDGQREAAKERWNFTSNDDRCTSVIAMCKEPSKENYRYLELLRTQDVDFDGYDEQGYSALDYAVLSQNDDFRYTVCDGLRNEFTRKCGDHPRLVAERIKDQVREAERRGQYREVFQKVFRPVLLANTHEAGGFQNSISIIDCIGELRRQYMTLLAKSREQRKTFDNFKYMRYTDFKTKLGKLPSPSSQEDMEVVRDLLHDYDDQASGKDKYVVFFSYRWLGRNAPDDAKQTQYSRMKSAMALFMDQHKELDEEQDVASIDQIDKDVDGKQRGINALPLIVAQCNAIVSLVDDTYFDRAWCVVEVQMMQILRDSYGLHECWNHYLKGDDQGPPGLHPAPSFPLIEDNLVCTIGSNKHKLKLSHAGDEHTVKFLVRQSKILGRNLKA